jgi:hypothetical protein
MSTSKAPAIIITNSGTITVSTKGKTYSAAPSHANYTAIKNAVKAKQWAKLPKLFDVGEAINRRGRKTITVKNGQVLCDGVPLHNMVVDRIFQFMKEGLDFKPLVNFLRKLVKNPSENSVAQLYKFMEANNLPVTWDGYILCYKRVTDDYRDFHTRSIDNRPGAKPKMLRSNVADDPNSACHTGLHVGGLNYVHDFANEGHVMLVKVDPVNVVSVPNDSSCGKCRVCEYEVLSEFYEGQNRKAEVRQTELENIDRDSYDEDSGEVESESVASGKDVYGNSDW